VDRRIEDRAERLDTGLVATGGDYEVWRIPLVAPGRCLDAEA